MNSRRPIAITCVLMLILGALAGAQTPKSAKRKLGPEVNTGTREILPIVSADGRTLYFVRKDRGEDAAAGMNAKTQAALDDLGAQLSKLDPATRKQMEDMLRQTRAQQNKPANLGMLYDPDSSVRGLLIGGTSVSRDLAS